MPPVFGPASPSTDALEVLRGRERTRRVAIAVAQHEQRELGPGEALLDHARAAASPNASPER